MINQNETGQRIRVIDAIRGFCLLGILLANMLIFQYGIYGKEEMQLFHPTPTDEVTHQVLKVAVEGSFMPIFMFLFGYSLFKLREGLIAKGLKPTRYMVRRFFMLIGLGLLHSMLLWEGDILLAYGITGFFLLLFVKRKPKTLIIWGVILSILMSGLGYDLKEDTPKEKARMHDYVEESITVYGEGTYQEIMNFRQEEDPLDLPVAVMAVLMALMPMLMMPMFLFGIAAANKQWFHNPKRERRKFAWLSGILLPLGLLLKAIAVLKPDWAWSSVLLSLGGQLLAFGYIFGLAVVMSFLSKRSYIIMAFESVGRMSMTNYLMQTVICTTIFYGYALGWFGEIGVLNGVLLGIAIYAVQAVVSSFILFWFKNGPFERLLRIATYWSFSGKARFSKKAADAQAADHTYFSAMN
ncbi:hypothetical protein BK120_17695 [Paenibacillus sp. FSL A5-0031]|uniref:DUF418 domain-containing protein n=1 Tax=Paenibacillus sp. FSL A5-0031 TaxID=1920420 RepID=UPI00096BD1C1|nr:DUF418 domain-containing protein [Paenibacillus sp. FSL A5-0031]OME81474.1 hypothetical protein BK120_17695 [Paenibacillus sp. FSL A5-0031]